MKILSTKYEPYVGTLNKEDAEKWLMDDLLQLVPLFAAKLKPKLNQILETICKIERDFR